jgi:hypothetical protein
MSTELASEGREVAQQNLEDNWDINRMGRKYTKMAQTSVIIPDDIYALLQQISAETGRSISSLCSDFIKDGVYQEIEHLNKVEVWKKTVATRRGADLNPTDLSDRL